MDLSLSHCFTLSFGTHYIVIIKIYIIGLRFVNRLVPHLIISILFLDSGHTWTDPLLTKPYVYLESKNKGKVRKKGYMFYVSERLRDYPLTIAVSTHTYFTQKSVSRLQLILNTRARLLTAAKKGWHINSV